MLTLKHLTQRLNPFGTGQCLSTHLAREDNYWSGVFQSLWNRAMSFDQLRAEIYKDVQGFNPFGTGQCLSTIAF